MRSADARGDERARRLLEVGLDAADEAAPEPGSRFGDYELLTIVGRGGMGVVYRARHIGIHRTVALKLIHSGELATEAEIYRFRAEAAAHLDHPHIVPVYHFGEREGQPFFTMRLLEGGNLAEALPALKGSQRRVATLLAKIARGVHHAHRHGVLHRDLKPSNILLDEQGEPYVADFGLARRLDEHGQLGHGSIGATPYAAPEQAAGTPGQVTFSADVYSLGVMLHELLTGELPSRDPASGSLQSPRQLLPALNRDLEAVCLKCLEPEPARRYPSAEELANNLDCCLRGAPPRATDRGGRVQQLVRWFRASPFAATAIVGLLLVTSAVAMLAWNIVRAQREVLRHEVLQINMYAAQAVAGQILFKFRELSLRLERCAADPRVAARILAGAAPEGEPDAIDAVLRACGVGSTFDSVRLYDRDAVSVVRVPVPTRAGPGTRFEFRDYIQHAQRAGAAGDRHPYIARAIHSEADLEIKLALSVPIFDEQRWVGLALATVGSDSAFDSLRLRDPHDAHRMAVLVGLRDRERHEPELPTEHFILTHERLAHGQAIAIQSPALVALGTRSSQLAEQGSNQFELADTTRLLADAEHEDPVPGFEGRWLAGFAPVGTTPYAVIVQTRDDAALAPSLEIVSRLFAWAGGVFALGVLLVLLVASALRVRRLRALG
jgi:serine/threonine-protein kinase